MTNGNYTLQDRSYFELLGRVSECFEEEGIEYALVGGTGIQTRVASILSKAHGTDVKTTPGLEMHLRGTKDFDIITEASEEDFVKYFNSLQATNAPHINFKRTGARRAILDFQNQNRIGVVMNYQLGPQDFQGLSDEFYFETLNSAENVALNIRNSRINPRVALPENLVASKLTRNNEKDVWDISALMRAIRIHGSSSSESFDEEKVRRYLEDAGKGETYGRLITIQKQIVQE